VVQLTSSSGAVTKSYNYDAFGNECDPDEEDTNPFRYCGEYFDKETGTYYLRARYYDPYVGRFTQSDQVRFVYRELPGETEIIDPLSLNLYVYCAHNPIAYCDPSGNAWEIIVDIVSTGISTSEFLANPTFSNAAFLAWDIGASLLPFVPGSYTAKGGKLVVKAVGSVDDTSSGSSQRIPERYIFFLLC